MAEPITARTSNPNNEPRLMDSKKDVARDTGLTYKRSGDKTKRSNSRSFRK